MAYIYVYIHNLWSLCLVGYILRGYCNNFVLLFLVFRTSIETEFDMQCFSMLLCHIRALLDMKKGNKLNLYSLKYRIVCILSSSCSLGLIGKLILSLASSVVVYGSMLTLT